MTTAHSCSSYEKQLPITPYRARRHLWRPIAFVAMFALVAGLLTSVSAPAHADSGMGDAVFNLLNKQRAERDPDAMRPLTKLPCLTDSAQAWTERLNVAKVSSGTANLTNIKAACADTPLAQVYQVIARGQTAQDVATLVKQQSGIEFQPATYAGVGCTAKKDKGGGTTNQCVVIVANPVPDTLTVTMFGDSYTAGNGTGTDNAMDWRGDPATKSFQSPRNQGSVLATLLGQWSGRTQDQIATNDYSHSGAVTATRDAAPLILPDNTDPETAARLAAADYDARVAGLANTKPMNFQIDQAIQDNKTKGQPTFDPGVILVGIGGNDIGFKTIAEDTLVGPYDAVKAQLAIDNATSLIQPAVQRAKDQVVRIIRNAAPNTVILVQGYPYLSDVNGELRALQRDLDSQFAAMVQSLQDIAKTYGVQVSYVQYDDATEGQAPYLPDGSANPSRTITTAFEAGDEQAFTLDAAQWIHPTAKLRHQEAQCLLKAMLSAPMSDPQKVLLGVYGLPNSGIQARLAKAAAANPLVITNSGGLPYGEVGSPYGFRFETANAPIAHFAVSGGNRLPPGLDMYSSGVIHGVPTTPGDYSFTVDADTSYDGVTMRTTADVTIHIAERPEVPQPAAGPAPAAPAGAMMLAGAPPATGEEVYVPAKMITPWLTLPPGRIGEPYSFAFEATGNPAPKFRLNRGELLPGMELDETTGVLSGTPTDFGSQGLEVIAWNEVGGGVCENDICEDRTVVNLDIYGPPEWVVPAGAVQEGQVGIPYYFWFRALADPNPGYKVTDGDLPPGTELNPDNGALSGTPTVAGTYEFELTATNPEGSAARTFVVKVSAEQTPAQLLTLAGDLRPGVVGMPYEFTFQAAGNPAPSFAYSGDLPPGLDFDEETGVLSGTPKTAGTWTFEVTASNRVKDDPKTSTGSYTVRIDPAGVPARLTTPEGALDAGQVGVTYNVRFEATGNPAPTFEADPADLPPGLTLNGTTGVLSGTPLADGVFAFEVTAVNRVNEQRETSSGRFEITIAPADSAPKWLTTAGALKAGKVGVAYSYTLVATGSPAPKYKVSDGDLPDGLKLNEDTGVVSGTPGVAGSYEFEVKASNPVGDQSARFTIVVDPEDVAAGITTPGGALALGKVGIPYDVRIGVTGRPAPEISWTGTLPPGLTLDKKTGVLSGTPATAGTYEFTVTATNKVNGVERSSSVTFTIEVSRIEVPAQLVTPPGELDAGKVGQAYKVTFTASGEPAAQFRVSGQWPAGLTLDGKTGVLSGTPAAAGTYRFQITAWNRVGGNEKTSDGSFMIRIDPVDAPAGITTAPGAIPEARAGEPYSYKIDMTGSPPPDVEVTGTIPPGMTFDEKTGLLSGTPTTPGTYEFSITVTNRVDGVTQSSTVKFTIKVNPKGAPAPNPPASKTPGKGVVAPTGGEAGQPGAGVLVGLGLMIMAGLSAAAGIRVRRRG